VVANVCAQDGAGDLAGVTGYRRERRRARSEARRRRAGSGRPKGDAVLLP
jgi:hypothetical protein